MGRDMSAFAIAPPGESEVQRAVGGRHVHRVNINFSEAAWTELQELAARRGKTISDVIREAIALAHWFERETDAGHRILVERNGEVREVVFR